MRPKVAFYGNNLNQGYFFTRALAELGYEARLFLVGHVGDQEHHEWWTDNNQDPALVTRLEIEGLDIARRGRLRESPGIRRLYDAVRKYDILIVREAGPALFSELHGVKTVFFSAGSDLQLLPFLVATQYCPSTVLHAFAGSTRHLLGGRFPAAWRQASGISRELLSVYILQQRQRAGLKRCAAFVCSPNQTSLVYKLGLSRRRVHYLPIPMYADVLEEMNGDDVRTLRQKHDGVEILFFHPVRQFYLRTNNNRFLKDNDKLLVGFARFCRETDKRVKLLLVRKGREADIESSERIIRQLQLEPFVEWLPEMPNKQLRAFYAVEQLVVCDQFGTSVGILGNVGREATYFGRPVITSFPEWNRLYFGNDWPPHVFHAESAGEVLNAMKQIAGWNREERTRVSGAARDWYRRQLDHKSLMPKYLNILLNL